MSSYRGRQTKPLFGIRGAQPGPLLPNPYVTEEDISTIRRPNMQFQSFPQNRMQSPFNNQQPMMHGFNKNYSDHSCKMSDINFSQEQNSSIFESVQNVPKPAYCNRYSNDRFSNNDSFNSPNIPYRMNEGSIKNFHGSNSMAANCQSDAYFDSKPLHSNMRQMQDRYSCMQSNQNQFPSNSQMSHAKNFPFINEKSLFPSNNDPFCNKILNSLDNTCLRSYKASNIFPAYAAKENPHQNIGIKSVEHPVYTSDFIEKPNTFVDNSHLSANYPKPSLSLEEKTYSEKAFEKAIDEFLQSGPSLSAYEKQNLKEISDPTLPFDEIVPAQSIGCVTSNFSLTPTKSQEPCFQTSNSMSFQKSQNMTSNNLSVSSSQGCLMQNTHFPAETEVQQTLKECIPSSSSFNFESSMSTTDIADLLPGIDVLVESLAKSEELVSKSGDQTNSVFSTEVTWPKPSIPFIGDNVSNKGTFKAEDSSVENFLLNEKLLGKSESKDESKSNLTGSVPENKSLESIKDKTSSEKDTMKVHSALEEALEMLVTNDAIVGLDYIIEYKKCINQKGSFPFKCTLCNSAISRPTIIDHIIGPKHRIRYLKTKNEAKYEEIKLLKVDRSDKDTKVAEASFELEKLYGRGHVNVEVEDNPKGESKVHDISIQEQEEEPVTVFTLDKIPIGFEALSPDHDTSSSFLFDPPANQDPSFSEKEKTNNNLKQSSPNCEDSGFTVPGLGFQISDSENPSSSISFSQDESMSNSEKNILKKESNIKESDSPIQIKRSVSPVFTNSNKLMKVSDNAKIVDEQDTKVSSVQSSDQSTKVKSEAVTNSFNPKILEELSKCSILSEEEADFALQAVNILLQMFLQFRLKHVSVETVQQMMKGLQCGSSVKIEELLILLNKDKHNDSEEKVNLKSEANNEEKIKKEALAKTAEIQSQMVKINDVSSCSTVSSTNSIPSSGSVGVNAPSLTVPLPTVNSSNNVSQYIASQVNASVGFPHQYFNWSQTSNPMQSPAVGVAGNQNMMWTASPYQSTQHQYGQMPFYQHQNFSNVHTGNPVYPNQFPVLQQNSMQVAPPPPVPPPPPPLPPSDNPPLPPCDPSVPPHNIPLPNQSMQFNNHPPPP